jgi:hypothetical protein
MANDVVRGMRTALVVMSVALALSWAAPVQAVMPASTGLTVSDSTTVTLVGAGDIASCSYSRDSATGALVAGVLAADPSAIAFTAGDNVYPDGTPSNYPDCYDPAWGSFRSRTRPAPGNHDYYHSPGAAGYFAYFGRRAGRYHRGWYKFTAGTWRVYSLNSECGKNTRCHRRQYRWLAADLVNNPHQCVMAIWHRPRFSTGPHGNSARMSDIFQLLYDHGAELVVAGHDHMYERYLPLDPSGNADPVNGIQEFVVGTGGAALYGFKTDSPQIAVRNNTAHGVLELTLAPGGYSWQFLATGGTFTDSGTASCH